MQAAYAACSLQRSYAACIQATCICSVNTATLTVTVPELSLLDPYIHSKRYYKIYSGRSKFYVGPTRERQEKNRKTNC